MNHMAAVLYIYARLLLLYPRGFRNEFAEEMQIVFRDALKEAIGEGSMTVAWVCLNELAGLPLSILREFWHEFRTKEIVMLANENLEPKTGIEKQISSWDAVLGTLPFALFGIMRMLAKFDLLFHGPARYLNDAYLDLAFYVVVLLGLYFGLIQGFPRWANSYLGWSLIFLWQSPWFLTAITGYEWIPWSWQIWSPFLVTCAAAVISTRSLRPLFQLVRNIWQDWTGLSLVMYTFVALIMLDFDENHSPYLMAFMIESTLVVAASVWIFMRSTQPLHRFVALLAGFAISLVVTRISESTWDIAVVYGTPAQPIMPWYDFILDLIVTTGTLGVFLLLPALLALIRSIINKDITT